jgi:hypothetical protein
MPPHAEDRLVACLCAAWCHVCNDYRSTFDALARESAPNERWCWIDIEDDEDLIDGVVVDDFPTLLVADRQGVRFFGVIAPSEKGTRVALARAVRVEPRRSADAGPLPALCAHILS